MWRGVTCSKTISWLTSANSGATSPTHEEMPILAEKGFVPMPNESMAFQRPASGLKIPHVPCTDSYLLHSGGNLKDDNDDCHQEERTGGNPPLSGTGGGVEDTTMGTRLSGSSTYFWASDNCQTVIVYLVQILYNLG